MTTLEMEIALMRYFDIRANLIVPNVSWGVITSLHECDLLVLSKAGYATEVEIKISKHDLLKDKEKKHGHVHHYIKHLYFAVPEKLKDIALAEIPDRAGLLTCKTIIHEGKKYRRAYTVKNPEITKNCHKWTGSERYQLARLGSMRILALKKKLQNKIDYVKELEQ